MCLLPGNPDSIIFGGSYAPFEHRSSEKIYSI